jgi:hypothetical protein
VDKGRLPLHHFKYNLSEKERQGDAEEEEEEK